METFGIWNLIKSLLTNDGQNVSAPATNPGPSPNNSEAPEGAPHGEPPIVPTEQPEQKANACEEYLLRHERLTNGKKR